MTITYVVLPRIGIGQTTKKTFPEYFKVKMISIVFESWSNRPLFLLSSTYLSFSFAFFVHGESTVCASVDVREHPPVYNLTRQHLTAAQASTTGTPVILAPNGLAGNLTGVAFKNSDTSTSRFLEEWRKFYPIHSKFLVRDPDPALPPPVVEIIVGGVKMKYPSCYVLVTDMDDPGSPMVPTSCLLGKAPAAVNNKLNTGTMKCSIR